MSAQAQSFDLRPYKAAGYPAVAVSSVEEERLTTAILEQFPEAAIHRIAAAGGRQQKRKARGGKDDPGDPTAGYAKAFAWLAAQQNTILIVFDFQHMIKQPASYRPLRDALGDYKQRGCLVVLVAPAWSLPPELQHEIPVIEYSLPSRAELKTALDVCSEAVETQVPDEEGMLDAASGITLNEAENSFALSYALAGFSKEIVLREKLRLIKGTGYLEVFPPVSPDQLGGLGTFREFILREVVPHKNNLKKMVKGLIALGVAGTGKSLVAKILGALLGWPVVRVDLGAVMGSHVGDSERQIREALALLEAIAPCIAFFDEVEKGVGGYQSSAGSDGGTLLRVVGTLLTWMQEHTSQIITYMTCNDFTKLPPELTRAGRVDEKFFVDLPTNVERPEIAAIHLRAHDWPVEMAEFVGSITENWTGAEIEQLIKSASRCSDTPNEQTLRECSERIKPIAVVQEKEVKALRDYANAIFVRANTPEVEVAPGPARRLTKRN